MKKPQNIAVIGLGYVGLPLAVAMAKKFSTIGFDINKKRVDTINGGNDPNGEVDPTELKNTRLLCTCDPADLAKADFVIVAVPTPVDSHNKPDMTPLVKSSETIGRNLKKGAVIVFESTVYPGATEEWCVPVIEKMSGLKWKKGFFIGYSPERINPGDKKHTFTTILKIVSGDTPETLEKVAFVYGSVVKAGIYKASSIKVAEAAKVIENTQRDINIAFMNELKILFDKMGISTREVLEAARTKWNFLPFEPGLVGGHCIGVDPYYLAYKAEEVGHHPQIIMAGRRINDAMGRYFARQLIKKLINRGKPVKDVRVLVCGLTFKEDVPDIRNTKVINIIDELKDFGIKIDVWEHVAYAEDIYEEYGIKPVTKPASKPYDAIVLAVKHAKFLKLGRKGLSRFMRKDGVFYDIKEVL
jgi:UDP-N-acetyl-D-galactosamine dehydrogenase